MIFLLRTLLLTASLFVASVFPAAAHPLGNFTINHLTKLSAASHAIDVRYVLDMAEIPTFSAMRAATPDGKMTPDQLAAWGRTQAQALAPELHFALDGRGATLDVDRVVTTTRPGAGGLPTLYLVLDGHVPVSGPMPRAIAYRDTTYAGRLGWRDVVVAPQTEPTRELTAYPNALVGSPRAVTAVAVAYAANGAATVTALDTDRAASAGTGGVPSLGRSNQLSDMLSRGTSDPGFVALVFLTAIFLGALHALEPGHGKTLLAISLVGARATVKQAAILASALTVAHTIGVLALGVAINLFKGYFVPESIYPWITLLSGIAIAIIGARAVQRQIQARQPVAHAHAHSHAATHPHEHEHVHEPGGHSHAPGEHAHSHADGHVHDDLEHARAHAIPGTAPLTFGGTVWAAMSGGIAPCPAALVVLLTALAVNQVAYGIFVIVAFSVGLAITLTGLGIAVVRGATWLQGRPQFERFVTYGPLISAGVISTIGAIMVGQGFAQQGVSISPFVITAIVAIAIVGYAFSHPFSHRRTEIA